jgi:hypothetical protein
MIPARSPPSSAIQQKCEKISYCDQNKKGGIPVSKIATVSRFVLFLFVATFATTAISGESPKPSGRVSISSRSIAAGIGVTWGDGKLSFKGKDYAFSIDGLTVVDFGISRANATGDVYNLTDVAKFAGTYVAAEAGFTLAGGMGGMVLRNQDGVVMHIRSTSRGARLQLGTSGLVIRMK